MKTKNLNSTIPGTICRESEITGKGETLKCSHQLLINLTNIMKITLTLLCIAIVTNLFSQRESVYGSSSSTEYIPVSYPNTGIQKSDIAGSTGSIILSGKIMSDDRNSARKDVYEMVYNDYFWEILSGYNTLIQNAFSDEKYGMNYLKFTKLEELKGSSSTGSNPLFEYEVEFKADLLKSHAENVNRKFINYPVIGAYYPADIIEKYGEDYIPNYQYAMLMLRRSLGEYHMTVLHEETFVKIFDIDKYFDEVDNYENSQDVIIQRKFNFLRKCGFYTNSNLLLLLDRIDIKHQTNSQFTVSMTVDLFDPITHRSINNVTVEGTGSSYEKALENAMNKDFDKILSLYISELVDCETNGERFALYFYSFNNEYEKVRELFNILRKEENFKYCDLTTVNSGDLVIISYRSTLPQYDLIEAVESLAKQISLPLNISGSIHRLTWFTPDRNTVVEELKERERFMLENGIN
ncbi:MAG: hypothetical protein PHW83_12435 [Bacteroidales bacterium]|nr:hypothetical protein [Bacteroidales bacterium]